MESTETSDQVIIKSDTELSDSLFDDLTSNDFMEGLNILDSWDENQPKTSKDIQEKNDDSKLKYQKSKSKSLERRLKRSRSRDKYRHSPRRRSRSPRAYRSRREGSDGRRPESPLRQGRFNYRPRYHPNFTVASPTRFRKGRRDKSIDRDNFDIDKSSQKTRSSPDERKNIKIDTKLLERRDPVKTKVDKPGQTTRDSPETKNVKIDSKLAERRDPAKTKFDIQRDKNKCLRYKEAKEMDKKVQVAETGLCPPGMEDMMDEIESANVFCLDSKKKEVTEKKNSEPVIEVKNKKSPEYRRHLEPRRLRSDRSNSPGRRRDRSNSYGRRREVSISPTRHRDHFRSAHKSSYDRRTEQSPESDREIWLREEKNKKMSSVSPDQKRRKRSPFLHELARTLCKTKSNLPKTVPETNANVSQISYNQNFNIQYGPPSGANAPPPPYSAQNVLPPQASGFPPFHVPIGMEHSGPPMGLPNDPNFNFQVQQFQPMPQQQQMFPIIHQQPVLHQMPHLHSMPNLPGYQGGPQIPTGPEPPLQPGLGPQLQPGLGSQLHPGLGPQLQPGLGPQLQPGSGPVEPGFLQTGPPQAPANVFPVFQSGSNPYPPTVDSTPKPYNELKLQLSDVPSSIGTLQSPSGQNHQNINLKYLPYNSPTNKQQKPQQKMQQKQQKQQQKSRQISQKKQQKLQQKILQKQQKSLQISQLFEDKKISLSDFLTVAVNGETDQSNIHEKIKVISRCQDAIKELEKSSKLSGRFYAHLSPVIPEVDKSLQSKWKSPLKRATAIKFNFTTSKGKENELQTCMKRLLTAIGLSVLPTSQTAASVAPVDARNQQSITPIQASVQKLDDTKSPLVEMKDSYMQTDLQICPVCKIRNAKKYSEISTQTVELKKLDEATQVSQNDLLPLQAPRGILKHSSSITHLTAAQLREQETTNKHDTSPSESIINPFNGGAMKIPASGPNWQEIASIIAASTKKSQMMQTAIPPNPPRITPMSHQYTDFNPITGFYQSPISGPGSGLSLSASMNMNNPWTQSQPTPIPTRNQQMGTTLSGDMNNDSKQQGNLPGQQKMWKRKRNRNRGAKKDKNSNN